MKECLLILSAEDDPNDVIFIKRAFAKNGSVNPIHACANAADAIAYFQGVGRYADRSLFPFPTLLITDIKMPGSDGFQLLTWIRSNPKYRLIPVVILSASNQEEDTRRGYELGANAFIKKPSDFSELTRTLGLMAQFWEICEKPSLPESPTAS
jgi:CheY-like chemotaxis protein